LTNDLSSSGIKYSIGIQSSYTLAVALGVVNEIILTKYLSYECLHLTFCDTSGGLLISLFQVLPGSNGELRETIWWTQWKLVVPLAAPVMGSDNSGSMAMGSASSGSVA
jgi:hypothetical protein